MSVSQQHGVRLDELLQGMTADNSVPSIQVSGISQDSRLLNAGDLYLAIGGASTHGLHFVPQALENRVSAVACDVGAAADFPDARAALLKANVPLIEVFDIKALSGRIAARFYGEPSKHLRVVGVTGTDGKTSVCRFVAQSLGNLGERCGYIGTLGWGFIDSLESTELTTPDAVSIQRMLASLLADGATAVAVEASSIGLSEGRLNAVVIEVAVLTNLGRDHLDYHQTLDDYRAAKSSLFGWTGLKAMVVNGDDSLGLELCRTEHAEQMRRVVFHAGPRQSSADTFMLNNGRLNIGAVNIKLNSGGLAFELADGSDHFQQQVRLMGRFNIDNLLACHGVLRALGYAANESSAVLDKVDAVPGRIETFALEGQPLAIVDFAHTPQALAAVIKAVRQHCAGELWLVFGCGGDRDPGKRAPMGREAEAADHVVVTDDNPRTENSADILNQIVAGMENPGMATVIADRQSAIEHALSQAESADIVLIAGKGHEDYQIVGTERLEFSDRATVNRLLQEAS